MNNSNDFGQTSRLLQVAEVKVTYQSKIPFTLRPKISRSEDAEEVFRLNWGEDMEFVEEFNVLFVTRSNHVKGLFRLSRGGMTGTVADPRILFATALKGMAAALVLGHNHPSGSTQPSSQDIALTRKFKEIGKYHDIPVLDHLILAPNSGYYSFADEGML